MKFVWLRDQNTASALPLRCRCSQYMTQNGGNPLRHYFGKAMTSYGTGSVYWQCLAEHTHENAYRSTNSIMRAYYLWKLRCDRSYIYTYLFTHIKDKILWFYEMPQRLAWQLKVSRTMVDGMWNFILYIHIVWCFFFVIN